MSEGNKLNNKRKICNLRIYDTMFLVRQKKGEYKDKINKSIRRKIITKRGEKNHHNSMYNSCFLRKVKEREKKRVE